MDWVVVILSSAFAQPAFDVASVRMYPSGSPFPPESQGFVASPDGIRGIHITIRGCLQWAYGIADVSGPPWINEESYDILAKAAGPVSDAELRQMLVILLQSRFSLKVHRETRSSMVGVLVVSKGGVKNLQAVENPGPVELKRVDGRLEITNAPMSRLAGVLASPLGNMPLEKVVDQTGLSGAYDITLNLKDFDPGNPAYGGYREMRDALTAFVSAALEKQYGLKVERRNLPAEVLVVDGGVKVPVE